MTIVQGERSQPGDSRTRKEVGYVKINEAEALVGITKKNIRYYESEGLLHPARDTSNGYRDYTREDIQTLKMIKVYRKLSLPIEEIKKIMAGSLTVGEALERHKIVLHHQKNDMDAQLSLCQQLIDSASERGDLDPDEFLSRIDGLEQDGVRFLNVTHIDRRIAKAGVWLSAAGVALFCLGLALLMYWGAQEDPMPIWGLLLLEAIILVPGIGVFAVGWQRIQEINAGEEDDLNRY